MPHFITLFARTAADEWLNDHPLVVVPIFGLLSAFLLYTGIQNVLSQQATDKWGRQHDGGMALFLGGARIFGGVVAAAVTIFCLFKAMF